MCEDEKLQKLSHYGAQLAALESQIQNMIACLDDPRPFLGVMPAITDARRVMAHAVRESRDRSTKPENRATDSDVM